MNEPNEEEFQKLKAEVEEAKEEADRSAGALQELLKRLKTEYDCKDLAEAKTLLEKIRRKRDTAKESFDKQLADYKRNWKN